MSTPFKFNLEKAIQASGVILREEQNHRMNYMKLLKLLAIAEREMLQATGRMITGDKIVALERGPLLSRVYDLIKGESVHLQTWQKFISRERYEVQLQANPGVTLLSRAEIEKLQEVAVRHANHDEWDMVKITHEHPEWKKNQPIPGSMKPIPLKDVLDAVGRGKDSDAILAEAAKQTELSDFFERHGACGKETHSQSQNLEPA